MSDQNWDEYVEDDAHEGEADDEFDFDCPAYQLPDGRMFCPAQGSEDCDWECPYGYYR